MCANSAVSILAMASRHWACQRWLQPFPPGIARVKIVPELDIVFVLFPAEKDFLAVTDGRKINQTAVDVFDLNLAPLEFFQGGFEVGRCPDPAIDGFAAHVIAAGHQAGEALVAVVELLAQGGEVFEPLPDLRQERPGLVPRVMLLKAVGHAYSAGPSPAGVASSFFFTCSLGSSWTDLRHASR